MATHTTSQPVGAGSRRNISQTRVIYTTKGPTDTFLQLGPVRDEPGMVCRITVVIRRINQRVQVIRKTPPVWERKRGVRKSPIGRL